MSLLFPSHDTQDLKIKAYDAETKRISAVQAGLNPDQIQDIVLGTVHGMLTSGDLVGNLPQEREQEPDSDDGMPQVQPQGNGTN